MPNLSQKMMKQNKKQKETLDKPESSVKPGQEQDHIEVSMVMANNLWDDIKRRVRDDPKFGEMPDNDKIEIYQKSKFKDFYIEFPIVSRYMICMGQFSNKAFKKYLLKCKNVVHDQDKSREKGYSEDQWVQRQADYIKYLWESYQKQHYSPSESKDIWTHAYTTLKQEFQDFKDLHEDIEKKLKEDEKTHKGEMAKELLKRLSSKEQALDDNTTKQLLEKLKDTLTEQRKKTLIESIKESVPETPPTRVARGSRKELKPAK